MKSMHFKLRSKMSHWPKISHRYVSKGWKTFMFYLTVFLSVSFDYLPCWWDQMTAGWKRKSILKSWTMLERKFANGQFSRLEMISLLLISKKYEDRVLNCRTCSRVNVFFKICWLDFAENQVWSCIISQFITQYVHFHLRF